MLTIEHLRMVGDRILVDPDERLSVSEGGLHIPDTVLADNPNYFGMSGIVVKVGDGREDAWYQCVSCERIGREARGSCPRCHLQLAGTNIRLHSAAPGKLPFDVEVGQRVVFNRFAGKQVVIDQADGTATKRYLIMREWEVLGVTEGGSRITPVYEAPKYGKVTDGNRAGIPVR